MTSERLQIGGEQVDLSSPYGKKSPSLDGSTSSAPDRWHTAAEKVTRVNAVGAHEPLPPPSAVLLYGRTVTDYLLITESPDHHPFI